MNIAVFVFAYPVLSETFVINELYQLQQAGVNGSIWREKSAGGGIHPKVGLLEFPLFQCPEKITGSHFFQLLSLHFWWLRNYPGRYLRLLSEVLKFFPDIESVKIFIKAVLPAKEVLEQKSTLVYVHESDRAYLFGLCAARLNALPLFIIFHTYFLFVKKKYVLSKVRTADGVIFQSEYSRVVVRQRIAAEDELRARLDNFFVVSSPGIDTKFFSPRSLLSRKSSNKENRQMRIVSVGRLEEAKGFEFLLKAVRLLKDRGFDVTCQIVGEGSYRARLEHLRAKLALEREVLFLGSLAHSDRLQRVLHESEYFVLPSIEDSDGVHDVHPNALKEAMSCGLIVVTTKLGGIDEVVLDGKNGFLVEHADEKEITDLLQRISRFDTEKRSEVKRHARATIVSEFGAREITRNLVKIFEKYAR